MPEFMDIKSSSRHGTLKSASRLRKIGYTLAKISPAETTVAETWIFQPWAGSSGRARRE
jgi:hypothetical protein